MARYILIDRDSGYIFADTANLAGFNQIDGTPADAAIALDVELRNTLSDYAETSRRDALASYDVYEGSDAIPVVLDGQSNEAVEAVERECRYVTTLRRVRK